MGNGIYSALSGAVAQSDALDVTANNVANASTAGFRAERVAFHQVVSRAAAAQTAFVVASGGATDGRAGELRQTGGALDVAIEGDGYFALDTGNGVRYTRAGDFQLDGTGKLVTADGQTVRGTGGRPIVVPTTAADVQIAGDGSVQADGVEVGRLELTKFRDGDLIREGDNRFTARRAGTAAGPDVQVVAGAIEQSDFDVVRGVVDLIRIQRTYESLHRMIESYREIDTRTARDIGGPA